MRYADAPPAGWYPDPEHSSRLRWWDGYDWSDIRRAPPSQAELIVAEENRAFFENAQAANQMPVQAAAPGQYNRQETQQIIAEVRDVARKELDRATEQFSQRATNAVRSVTPLISDYTNKITKWVRRVIVLAVVLLVAYVVFQIVAQASFFDWLGDRIDNLTDPDESGATAVISRFVAAPSR